MMVRPVRVARPSSGATGRANSENVCQRCKLPLPPNVFHADAEHCLATLVSRYAMLSRAHHALKRSVFAVEQKVTEWRARAKHAEGELIAIQGKGEMSHEQRIMQLEQRVKFLMGQQRESVAQVAVERKQAGRSAA